MSTVGDRAIPVAVARVWDGHTAANHVGSFAVIILQSPEDTSLQALLSLTYITFSSIAS